MSDSVRDGAGSGSGSDGDSGRVSPGEDLTRLHAALAERGVPGLKLDLRLELGPTGSPAVYTDGTCTRVRAGCFLIHRMSPHGQVLETASLGVGRQATAVALIALMSGALTL